MGSMLEAQRVMSYVVGVLQADTAAGGVAALLGGRIYRDRVPAAAALPAATVTLVSATDVVTLGGRRVIQTVLVDVRVVGSGSSYGPINPAADRVDVLLDERHAEANGVDVVKLRRDQAQAYLESDAGGATFCHVIQTYRSESYALPS